MTTRTSHNAKHIILGAGIAGLSAAYHLSEPYEIFEAKSEIGGVAGSVSHHGFIFDHAIHVLYTKDPYASKLIRYLLQDNFVEHERSSWIFSCGMFTPYPYQAHTYGLPDDIIRENLDGLIEAQSQKDEIAPRNFEEWILGTFGTGIAKNFMLPFNRKVWATNLRTMGFSWIADRVATPNLKQIFDGAYSPAPIHYGPNAQFWYPRSGGIGALPNAIARRVMPVRTNMGCISIDSERKLVTFQNGEKHEYKTLISTLPIPTLVRLLGDIFPDSIRERIAGLRSNRVITVNLGIARANISDKHWIYFPEEGIEFHRVSFPSNFSDGVAPKGTSSIMVEISESPSRNIHHEGIIKRTISTLIEIGIINSSDEIVFSDTFEIDPAYIVPSQDHDEAVAEIQLFLGGLDIFSCGRFGEWMYFNMDQSILSGKHAAERAMSSHNELAEISFAEVLN